MSIRRISVFNYKNFFLKSKDLKLQFVHFKVNF